MQKWDWLLKGAYTDESCFPSIYERGLWVEFEKAHRRLIQKDPKFRRFLRAEGMKVDKETGKIIEVDLY